MTRHTMPPERYFITRIGWLRAAMLGAMSVTAGIGGAFDTMVD